LLTKINNTFLKEVEHMKISKKIIAAMLAAIILLSLAGCGKPAADAAKTPVNIATLKGPTGIGMVNLMEESDKKTTANDYTFTLEAAPTDIVPLISTGAADIAACPLNVAATLYNKTNGGVQILAINTLGVLYILEQGDTIKSVADLKGKTIYSSGQGSTPEYILNFVLTSNGLDPKKDVTVEYKADHSELAALAASGSVQICLLPEPFVTTVLSKNDKLRNALDMTVEWAKASAKEGVDSTLAMGCIIVRKDFAQKNPDAVKSFMAEYKASVNFVQNNVSAAAELVAKREIIASADLAKKAIPTCSIVFIDGAQMNLIAKQNLDVLFIANPASIGGAQPSDDFYYAD
jgi:NitT/TauT family transport system substrate-binding protein